MSSFRERSNSTWTSLSVGHRHAPQKGLDGETRPDSGMVRAGRALHVLADRHLHGEGDARAFRWRADHRPDRGRASHGPGAPLPCAARRLPPLPHAGRGNHGPARGAGLAVRKPRDVVASGLPARNAGLNAPRLSIRCRRRRIVFDTLITNGRIIDGTGRTWFHAAVGIEGETVTVMQGDVSAVEAHRTIDATGLIVCPGFIDMHSHSEFALLTNPRHEPKVSQGVTTEALGQDGLSYAPYLRRQPSSPHRLSGRRQWPPARRNRMDVGRVVPEPVRRRVIVQRRLFRSPRRAPSRSNGLGEPPAH